MTLLLGEKYQLESRQQFMDRLSVSWAEVFNALVAQEDDQLEQEINQFRADNDLDPISAPVDSIDGLTREFLQEACLAGYGLNTIIIAVLNERDRAYTHTTNGVLHTIIEVTGAQAEVQIQPYGAQGQA